MEEVIYINCNAKSHVASLCGYSAFPKLQPKEGQAIAFSNTSRPLNLVSQMSLKDIVYYDPVESEMDLVSRLICAAAKIKETHSCSTMFGSQCSDGVHAWRLMMHLQASVVTLDLHSSRIHLYS
ncbi:hypothetical protein CDAR_216871 [Caerostris darwini]|uniref:Uncharacterized protein n=1 Tax=Caerostris darwini TaxID=1538125 RepID=A0AAV4UQ07_9ARAC|nr:hypothetical protein CDAR_216871 [Caerostris darwini]